VLGKVAGIALAGLALSLPVQARAQAQTQSRPALSERAEKGRLTFDHRCYVCHQRDSDRVRDIAPPLTGLFQRERLVTGKPVTPENVKEIIKMGPTANMPAFRYTLSDPEIDDLIEFLKTK
jgi:mono/diheme cytochrome c family protein